MPRCLSPVDRVSEVFLAPAEFTSHCRNKPHDSPEHWPIPAQHPVWQNGNGSEAPSARAGNHGYGDHLVIFKGTLCHLVIEPSQGANPCPAMPSALPCDLVPPHIWNLQQTVAT